MKIELKVDFWYEGIEDSTDEEIKDYLKVLLENGAEVTCSEITLINILDKDYKKNELYNQFGDNDAFKLKDLQDNCNHFNIDYLKTYTNNNKDFWSDLICTDCGKNMGINYRVYWKIDDNDEEK